MNQEGKKTHSTTLYIPVKQITVLRTANSISLLRIQKLLTVIPNDEVIFSGL